ncbi:MAG: sodium-dependent transporter [Pseudomonadales bacterium]|nr:sodium-dependent transporter [Pseudomonadales bacterium]
MTTPYAAWSSRLTFILAAIGAAVGLGNIWKFPYMAGTHGGGAFVAVYLGCVVLIAIPILIAELLLGRAGRGAPPTAMANVAGMVGARPAWALVGWLGAAAGFLIVTFYSVIGGWVLAYLQKAATGQLADMDATRAAQLFADLLAAPGELLAWHTVFMGATVLIVARGLEHGIEAAVKWLMPALFVMLLVMLGYSLSVGDAAAGLDFMFAIDAARIDGEVVLMAIGQAFFSIGVAMGLMMMYAAYLPAEVSIPRAAVGIATVDTLVAILAGLVIFPLVFANGLDPAEGPGLIFVTLPIAFASMPFGAAFAALFFVLLLFAALSSAIALIEPMVARVAERPGARRAGAAWLTGAAAWLIGIASVLSFNHWSDLHLFGDLPLLGGKAPFDLLDYATANLMMPLGGMLIALFAGWQVTERLARDQLPTLGLATRTLWRWSMRIVVPAALALVFVANLL